MDVAGVKIQAGFYEDTESSLLYRRNSWVSHFMVSYATDDNPQGFTYISGDDGNPQVTTLYNSNHKTFTRIFSNTFFPLFHMCEGLHWQFKWHRIRACEL